MGRGSLPNRPWQGLGRPLNGIWATAPYLHNGSVPNLWELLKKPKDSPINDPQMKKEFRIQEFWVGSREFDPDNVGFDTKKGLSHFKVFTSEGKIQGGNSNLGHTWGTRLSDEQKKQLLEYMKTL